MFYKALIRPMLFQFPPELIHRITFTLFRFFPFMGSLISLSLKRTCPVRASAIDVFGLRFRHPVGLAGGMDKNAIAIRFMRNIGFSFVEIGTVTPKAQIGNPRPRLFRLTRNQAMINRMGFNNDGVHRIARRLTHRPARVIIGGNIGKNSSTSNEEAWKDYVTCFHELYPYVDYFVVNVSCPNIRDLAELQNRDYLSGILDRLVSMRLERNPYRPILLKISPDLTTSQLDEVIAAVRATGIDGVIAVNTSVQRYGLDYNMDELARFGEGGLSGRPLGERSTEIIRYLSKKLGPDFPIVASGGIMTPEDAMEKLEAGARLVQIYTGFVYEGPGLLRRILKHYLRRVKSMSQKNQTNQEEGYKKPGNAVN